MIVAFAGLIRASGVFLESKSEKIVAAPPLAADVTHVLLKTQASASGSEDDEFTKGCLAVSKAIVAENDGKKKGVASQLSVICSGLQLPLDVELCGRYRSTLLNHLHRDAAWNLLRMDFPLFCKGMDKVVAQHKAEIEAMVKAQKAGAPDSECFKENAVYGFAPSGSCATAKAVKMFGVGPAVALAKTSFGMKDEDISKTPIASAIACQAECQKTPDCEYFTYLTTDVPDVAVAYKQTCWLTGEVTCTPAYGFDPSAKGKIAGPRSCSKKDVVKVDAPAGLSP